MRTNEVQIKQAFFWNKSAGNTSSSAFGTVWDGSGKPINVALPFGYGSEPKRKLLLKMFEAGLIPVSEHWELENKNFWTVEVIDFGYIKKSECIALGKDAE